MAAWNDDVLFIHIPKTAGMSLRNHLKLWGTTPFHELRGPETIDHVPLKDIPLWTGRTIDSFALVIAIFRDPYEHTLSQWWQWRDSFARGGRTEAEYEAAMAPNLSQWLTQPYSDYPTYYETVLKADFKGEPHPKRRHEIDEVAVQVRKLSYYQWWVTVDGAVPDNVLLIPFTQVDGLGTLLQEYTHMGAPEQLVHKNTSRRRDAMQYYDNLACELVEARYRWAYAQGWFNKMER